MTWSIAPRRRIAILATHSRPHIFEGEPLTKTESTAFFDSTVQPARGAVVVVHGLNNRPEVMDALIEVLRPNGFNCVRVGLYQSRPNSDLSPRTLARRWVDNVAEGYAEASRRYERCQTYGLGYSLGALAMIRFLLVNESASFKRMVLLAPPVGLTHGASLVRLLTPLASFGMTLPSLAPKAVRARSETPLVEYAGMLRLIEEVQRSNVDSLRQIETKVILDRQDELVSRSAVGAWISRNQLGSWTTKLIKRRSSTGSQYKHLMISEQSLGWLAWSALTKTVVEHFTHDKEAHAPKSKIETLTEPQTSPGSRRPASTEY